MNEISRKIESYPKDDSYLLHRTALKPLLPHAEEKDMFESCAQINRIGESEFLKFLHQQGLAPMWHKVLHQVMDKTLISETFIESLYQTYLLATATYMLQLQGLKTIKSTLGDENISHVIFKGCHIRESIYHEPAIRPACDIDLLISSDNQTQTAQALVNAGYKISANAENISHEVTLNKGGISIDLHWDIMRPGRTRTPMTESLLKTRRENSTHWGLNDEATLFLMLVHPVFTKYSTTPHSSLVRLVDLAHWIEAKKLNWEGLSVWLEEAGMQTAAWITLEWLRQLFEVTIPDSFMNKIQPGNFKTIYLRHWIKENYSSKFLEYPLLIQAAFTLPAHDNFTDAICAIKTMQKAKKLAPRKMDELTTIYERDVIRGTN